MVDMETKQAAEQYGCHREIIEFYEFCDDSLQAKWVKTVKAHCRGIAKSPVGQTVGRTCVMILATSSHRESGLFMSGKKILCSIAIDWVTCWFMVASI